MALEEASQQDNEVSVPRLLMSHVESNASGRLG
jgi:hypothetical protein